MRGWLPPIPTGRACCIWCRKPVGGDPEYVLVPDGTLTGQWWHMTCRDEMFKLEADGLLSTYESSSRASARSVG
jgi:hypothetical protein